jgi:Uma2 family endonuclease
VDQLPSESPRLTPPEGDAHRIPKERATQALGEYFRRMGRGVYLSSELQVYYPDEPWFAPDLIAVLDVPTHPREKWVVLHEGKGLDFVLEVTLSGDRTKDLETNVERYARLGIPEYFVLDLRGHRLLGHRLDQKGQRYEPIVPQRARWASRVLGLELTMEEGRVRFFAGSAPLLETDELIGRLDTMVAGLIAREEELAASLDAERSRAESAEQRAERLAARLRELGEDPDAG